MQSSTDDRGGQLPPGHRNSLNDEELLAGRRADFLALALMLLFALCAFLTVAIPVGWIELQDKFSLSSSDIGLLTSMYTFTYTSVAVPMGLATARWGGRTLLAALGIIAVGVIVFTFCWLVTRKSGGSRLAARTASR